MAHLAEMDAITLTKLILDANTRAAENSDACKDLFRRIKFIGNLLVELRVFDLYILFVLLLSLFSVKFHLFSVKFHL